MNKNYFTVLQIAENHGVTKTKVNYAIRKCRESGIDSVPMIKQANRYLIPEECIPNIEKYLEEHSDRHEKAKERKGKGKSIDTPEKSSEKPPKAVTELETYKQIIKSQEEQIETLKGVIQTLESQLANITESNRIMAETIRIKEELQTAQTLRINSEHKPNLLEMFKNRFTRK